MTKDKQRSAPAKKPKKAPAVPGAVVPTKTTAGALAVASLRKKRW